MPSLNKKSVRDEVARLKAEFEKLTTEGKVGTEVNLLLNSMFMIIELILSIFLEKITKKDSTNSSKPSSQTDKDDSALVSSESKGKGKSENNTAVSNTRTKKNTVVIEVNECNTCGKDLSGVSCIAHERRTKIDIIFEKVVDHFDAEVKECPHCNSITKGEFPKGMDGPLQYGKGLKAFIINLLVCQMVALNRVQKLIKSMIGTLISEASLLKFVLRLHQALAGWESSAIASLLTAPTMHVDETSLRVDKKNHWIHVYSAGEITLKFLHRRRGLVAIDFINIIPRYGGTIIHDCLPSYLSYKHCGHALCGSHLLRELTFVVDSNGYAWAVAMKRLLKKTCKKVSKNKQKKLTNQEYANLQKQYRTILTKGEKELPPIPPKPSGKPGKLAKSDAHNLWERLKKHETAVLLFAKNAHVAFTNNRAERDLRMAKVKQKVSGCFRTQIYAEAYCRISSYLQTMANKGYNPLIAIQMALSGKDSSDGGE